VTQADVDIVLNTAASGGYKPEYDIDHNGVVDAIDAFLLLGHNGEVCVPNISFFC